MGRMTPRFVSAPMMSWVGNHCPVITLSVISEARSGGSIPVSVRAAGTCSTSSGRRNRRARRFLLDQDSRPRTPAAGDVPLSGYRHPPSSPSEPPVSSHRMPPHPTICLSAQYFRPSRIGELLRRSSPCLPRAGAWAFDSSGSNTRAHVSALKVRLSLDLARRGPSATDHRP
jgi:hypothetical protein